MSPDPASQGEDFAAQIRGAENSIARGKEAESRAEAGKKPPLEWKNFLYGALIFVSFFTIYRNLPEFAATSFTQKPLRYGSYDTDKNADLCISNLWAIAAALRSGARLPAFTCPASGVAYIAGRNAVRCPNPSLHGAIKLYADKKNIIPFLQK
ncbi:MAG: hypothetical protein A2285_06625 [Elusimicrobia bacterium RIFOXYA12_FULL_57_11]|nr:MAG: hypothetical protein A2285_06625 [Elusimicrobia bacterium RIFOXYA12_FULL_57_11]